MSRSVLGHLLASLLLLAGPASLASAATNVSGSLSGNNAWTAAGSPYNLTGDTTVSSGATLVIEPGVHVQSQNGSRLNIVGKLTAVGISSDPIDFSIEGGLHFYIGSAGSEIAFSTIRNANEFGITNTDQCGSPWPALHDIEFRNNRFGVYWRCSSQPHISISDARFVDNDYGVTGANSSVSLNRISIQGATEHSLIATGGPITITNSNLFPPAAGTSDCGQNRGCTIFVESQGTLTNTATGNWWGTTNLATIQEQIYDSSDDPARDTVAISPIALVPYDLYPPTSSPANGASGFIPLTTSSLTGAASDNSLAQSGIASVMVSITRLSDGSVWNGSSWVLGPEAFLPVVGTNSWHVAAPPLTNGVAYRIRSLATDSEGNDQWGATSVTLTADGAAPQTVIDSGPGGLTGDNTPTFSFSGNETGTTFACSVDGSPFSKCSGPGSSHTTQPLLDGPHTFEVRAIDRAGNVDDSPAIRNFTTDTTAPLISVLKKPKSRIKTRKKSVELRVSFRSEPGATTLCRIDHARYRPCISPFSAAASSLPGRGKKHSLSIKAADPAGNAGKAATISAVVIRVG